MNASSIYIRNLDCCIEDAVLSLQLLAKRKFAPYGSQRLVELKLVPLFLLKTIPKLVDVPHRAKLSQVCP